MFQHCFRRQNEVDIYTTEKCLIDTSETILIEICHVVCVGFVNIPVPDKIFYKRKVFASFYFSKIIFYPDFIGNRQAENFINIFSGYNRGKRRTFNLLQFFFCGSKFFLEEIVAAYMMCEQMYRCLALLLQAEQELLADHLF